VPDDNTALFGNPRNWVPLNATVWRPLSDAVASVGGVPAVFVIVLALPPLKSVHVLTADPSEPISLEASSQRRTLFALTMDIGVNPEESGV
jgi:hypothetical protein